MCARVCVTLETVADSFQIFWPLAAPALAEGKEAERQGKLPPCERGPHSEEKPAATQLVRQVSGTHSSTKGHHHLFFLCLFHSV